MASDNTIRWTITVSKDTDIALRRLLAQRGLQQEDDLSRFIEDAVKWQMFDQTITEARREFADLAPAALQDLLNEATESVRNNLRETLAHETAKEA